MRSGVMMLAVCCTTSIVPMHTNNKTKLKNDDKEINVFLGKFYSRSLSESDTNDTDKSFIRSFIDLRKSLKGNQSNQNEAKGLNTLRSSCSPRSLRIVRKKSSQESLTNFCEMDISKQTSLVPVIENFSDFPSDNTAGLHIPKPSRLQDQSLLKSSYDKD